MERKTGIAVPLGAIRSKKCPAVGDFPALKEFADFCKKSGVEVIQLLPVNDTGTQSSPYSALSAYALHPIYIRIEDLPEFEDAKKYCRPFSAAYKEFLKTNAPGGHYSYEKVCNEKIELLHLLYSHMVKKVDKQTGHGKNTVNVVSASDPVSIASKFQIQMKEFIEDNPWVIYYAVFKDLKDSYSQASWKEWDDDKKNMSRHQIELRWSNRALRTSHNFFIWCQVRAHEQFLEAANYVREQGIILKGDIPILINEDSVDCWAWPELFDHKSRVGSPPDGGSPTGQRWGFPVYKWSAMQENNFSWWKDRLVCAGRYFSAFRLDHVIGFFRMWIYPEKETTAALGYPNYYSTMEKEILEDQGFSKDRLEWLSKPHIPTSLISDVTGSKEIAESVLEKICYRIGSEDLWKFKEDITSDSMIYSTRFCEDDFLDQKIAEVFAEKWLDRTLLEIEEGQYVPVWKYRDTTAWKSLDENERKILEDEFSSLDEKNVEIWLANGKNTLSSILSATKMQPCGEDLGPQIPGMRKVLVSLNVALLRVLRWTREWEKEGSPYESFSSYPPLCVSCVSVHDSSTSRQWWNEEKESVYGFFDAAYKNGCPTTISPHEDFSPAAARFVLESSAQTSAAWFINPLQDYLYLDKKFYCENLYDERINIPGTVNENNWTYRMPAPVEELMENTELLAKINSVCEIHKKFTEYKSEKNMEEGK